MVYAADVCIVCCDGLTGLPDAITVVWPQATKLQLCVVHLIRSPLRYASKKDWGALTKDLRVAIPRSTRRPPKQRWTPSSSVGPSVTRRS